MVWIAVLAVLATAEPSQLPPGYTCSDVRRLVAEHGRLASIEWALKQGWSLPQIWHVRRECKV